MLQTHTQDLPTASYDFSGCSFTKSLTNCYHACIQNISYYLKHSGWRTLSFVIPAAIGEPLESIKSAARRIFGWESTLNHHGFYDAADQRSLENLKAELKANLKAKDRVPVLLFHGLYSTPDIWVPWANQLQKAYKENKIGALITIQLPNDLEERMKVVYKAINDITQIYKEHAGVAQVDLMGHSLGGFASHLAAYKPEALVLKDGNVVRRWHEIGKEHQNEKVRKVITVAAPTWLCCKGQKDETHEGKPLTGTAGIYPTKLFSEKDIEKAFTPEQLKEIRSGHDNIYDIIGALDAICPSASALPEERVFSTTHAHLGVVTCPEVCDLAISLLSKGV